MATGACAQKQLRAPDAQARAAGARGARNRSVTASHPQVTADADDDRGGESKTSHGVKPSAHTASDAGPPEDRRPSLLYSMLFEHRRERGSSLGLSVLRARIYIHRDGDPKRDADERKEAHEKSYKRADRRLIHISILSPLLHIRHCHRTVISTQSSTRL